MMMMMMMATFLLPPLSHGSHAETSSRCGGILGQKNDPTSRVQTAGPTSETREAQFPLKKELFLKGIYKGLYKGL